MHPTYITKCTKVITFEEQNTNCTQCLAFSRVKWACTHRRPGQQNETAAPVARDGRPYTAAQPCEGCATAMPNVTGPDAPESSIDPLRNWGRTARLCVIRLVAARPAVMMAWLSTRR